VKDEQVDGSLDLKVGVGSGRVGRLKNETVVNPLLHSSRDVDYINPLVEGEPDVHDCCPWFSALDHRAVRMEVEAVRRYGVV
jgi:hypothetical protein